MYGLANFNVSYVAVKKLDISTRYLNLNNTDTTIQQPFKAKI